MTTKKDLSRPTEEELQIILEQLDQEMGISIFALHKGLNEPDMWHLTDCMCLLIQDGLVEAVKGEFMTYILTFKGYEKWHWYYM